MKPSKLLGLLSSPGGASEVRLVVSQRAGEEPYSGWLEDPSGKVVARLDCFRFKFVNFEPVSDLERMTLSGGAKQASVFRKREISAFDHRLKWIGETLEVGDWVKGFNDGRPGSRLEFESTARCIELAFLAHGWSGIATIDVDGTFFCEVDLFNLEIGILRRIQVDNPECRRLKIVVTPTGRSSPASMGKQMLLELIVEHESDLQTPVYCKHSPRNRGGDFRPKFFEVLNTLGPEAVVLDIGGGRRQIADDRYLNLDYSLLEEPDLLGDGTQLPFRSNSIDFVYTAAVLEHVTDPRKMGQEIHRVLKPGGKVLANSAFMQPVHSEGQHFFNLTPYGIALSFGDFKDPKVWWDVGFSFTIEWFLQVAEVAGKVDTEKLQQFVALAKEIEPHISNERGMYIASGVWLEAEKH